MPEATPDAIWPTVTVLDASILPTYARALRDRGFMKEFMKDYLKANPTDGRDAPSEPEAHHFRAQVAHR
jgi:hypothetical protein